ncbi:MAG: ATP-binding cassette domain-containing protein [Simkaniaceae bacterium]
MPVLKNVSFEIKRGESVALVGPSGSGKTTLFNLIAKIYPLQKGEIHCSLPLTYMMQEDLLLPWKNVQKNVCFGQRRGKKEARALLRRMGLESFEMSYPHQLSGGMKQRVSLARALYLKRPFLLLDEPFHSLDPNCKNQLYALVREIEDLSLFFITHDYEEAKLLARRILIIEEGKVQDVSC